MANDGHIAQLKKAVRLVRRRKMASVIRFLETLWLKVIAWRVKWGMAAASEFKANLAGANLVNAHLAGANLVNAHLVKANLAGADLSGALVIEGKPPRGRPRRGGPLVCRSGGHGPYGR